ncbi:MAG: hypothetical protein ACRDVE_17875 [Actinocrinis sp.]
MNASEHLAEAERLLALAHGLRTNHTDAQGRVTLASESAGQLAALASAHASIAAAMEAAQTRNCGI